MALLEFITKAAPQSYRACGRFDEWSLANTPLLVVLLLFSAVHDLQPNASTGVGVASAAPLHCSSLPSLRRAAIARCNYSRSGSAGAGEGAVGAGGSGGGGEGGVLDVDFGALGIAEARAAARSALRRALLQPLTCAPLQSQSFTLDLRNVCTYATFLLNQKQTNSDCIEIHTRRLLFIRLSQ